ncbi:MAG: pilus assembly protein TadG-related protein, partial [Beijerinckiaceae bacterium]
MTAVIFAVAATMGLVGIGAAIDTSRALHAKTKLQAAADAAALLAKRREIELRKTKSVSEAQLAAPAAARQLFSANIQELGAMRTGTVTAEVTYPSSADAKVRGSGEVDYVFGKLVGLSSAKIQVESVATLGDALPVEVSLVLDTTASMFATDGRSQTRFT